MVYRWLVRIAIISRILQLLLLLLFLTRIELGSLLWIRFNFLRPRQLSQTLQTSDIRVSSSGPNRQLDWPLSYCPLWGGRIRELICIAASGLFCLFPFIFVPPLDNIFLLRSLWWRKFNESQTSMGFLPRHRWWRRHLSPNGQMSTLLSGY